MIYHNNYDKLFIEINIIKNILDNYYNQKYSR